MGKRHIGTTTAPSAKKTKKRLAAKRAMLAEKAKKPSQRKKSS
jgi:hypothetical protein